MIYELIIANNQKFETSRIMLTRNAKLFLQYSIQCNILPPVYLHNHTAPGEGEQAHGLKVFIAIFNQIIWWLLNLMLFSKNLSRKHANLFLSFRLWIWWHRHYFCVFFCISNMWDVDSYHLLKQGALSLRHVSTISHAWFLRTRPIIYEIFRFCMT